MNIIDIANFFKSLLCSHDYHVVAVGGTSLRKISLYCPKCHKCIDVSQYEWDKLQNIKKIDSELMSGNPGPAFINKSSDFSNESLIFNSLKYIADNIKSVSTVHSETGDMFAGYQVIDNINGYHVELSENIVHVGQSVPTNFHSSRLSKIQIVDNPKLILIAITTAVR